MIICGDALTELRKLPDESALWESLDINHNKA
jgi:hypothetical protein